MPKLETMILTAEQRNEIGANWGKDSCPTLCIYCNSIMVKIPANPKGQIHAAKKPELYCPKCRVSAPLFDR